MAKIAERTPQRMTLQSGSTKFVLDKETSKATMSRKLLLWALKPVEVPLADVVDVSVDAGVDRASGVEICNTVLVLRSGVAWSLPAADKKDAAETAAAIGNFLGLQ